MAYYLHKLSTTFQYRSKMIHFVSILIQFTVTKDPQHRKKDAATQASATVSTS